MSDPTVVAFANQKGGAGKSTNAVHTAGALARRGPTAFVDVDKHGGVTNAFGYGDEYYLPDDRDEAPGLTLYQVLRDLDATDRAGELVIERDEMDLVPSTEQFMSRSNVDELAEAPRSHERLSLAIDALEGYEYVVVDTPPDLNILSNMAIVAADALLMPFIPEKLNQNSLVILRKQLLGLKKAYPVNPVAVVASRVGDNLEHQAAIEAVDERLPYPMLTVRKTAHLSKAIDAGQSIFEYPNQSPQAERARATFDEIADLIEQEAGRDE